MDLIMKTLQNYYDELIHYLTVVIGKKQLNIPLSTWKEELADDLLRDWIKTLLEVEDDRKECVETEAD